MASSRRTTGGDDAPLNFAAFAGGKSSEFVPDLAGSTQQVRRAYPTRGPPSPPRPPRTTFADAQSLEFRRRYGNFMKGLNAYDRHKHLINDYVLSYGRLKEYFDEAPSVQLKTDHDVLQEEHLFIRDDDDKDDSELTWEQRVARKYYDKLFKEYCLADLSRYKLNQIGFRWRVEDEVLKGKGHFICAGITCQTVDELKSYEVMFSYEEHGEMKSALVKCRLCPRCARKMNWGRRKERQRADPAAKKHRRKEKKHRGQKRGDHRSIKSPSRSRSHSHSRSHSSSQPAAASHGRAELSSVMDDALSSASSGTFSADEGSQPQNHTSTQRRKRSPSPIRLPTQHVAAASHHSDSRVDQGHREEPSRHRHRHRHRSGSTDPDSRRQSHKGKARESDRHSKRRRRHGQAEDDDASTPANEDETEEAKVERERAEERAAWLYPVEDETALSASHASRDGGDSHSHSHSDDSHDRSHGRRPDAHGGSAGYRRVDNHGRVAQTAKRADEFEQYFLELFP